MAALISVLATNAVVGDLAGRGVESRVLIAAKREALPREHPRSMRGKAIAMRMVAPASARSNVYPPGPTNQRHHVSNS
jgi:hypothetical protein